MSDSCIELGFLEEAECWELRSKYFPSKVGGKPAWLSLDSIPACEQLACQKCSKPLVFLCQVYAPVTEKEDCFHRTIFVFLCRNGECSAENDGSNLKVFRCQLPRDNRFYSFEPSKEEEDDSYGPSASDYAKLCVVCGCLGPKICGGCKKNNYCSKDHQALDWRAGHKVICKDPMSSTTVADSQRGILFPEFEIDLEPEEVALLNEKSEGQVLSDYEDLLRKGQPMENLDDVDPNADLVKMAAKDTDKAFTRFRTRIKDYPDQVMRYEKGGQPLLVSSRNPPQSIPKCEQCGGDRQFEFQIMPQLLVHMKVDSTGPSIDWGTVLIYTCQDSCSAGSSAYVTEAVHKQDYTPDLSFLDEASGKA